MTAEHDPTGKSAHEPGAKLDAGKARCGLVLGGFALALEEVARVGTYGANKYTPNGWVHVPNGVERYTDAMWRHLLKEAQGERCDKDTDLMHAAHAAWNALARLDLMLRESRVLPGVSTAGNSAPGVSLFSDYLQGGSGIRDTENGHRST